jgi:hypothetical protein
MEVFQLCSLLLFCLEALPKKANICLSKTPFHCFWPWWQQYVACYSPLTVKNLFRWSGRQMWCFYDPFCFYRKA